MVVRDTPYRSAICVTGISGSDTRRRISRTCLLLKSGLRPPLRPLARAASRPATVLSRIRFLSNSAREANTWNMRRPAALPVSIFSVRLSKETPRCSNPVTVCTRSARLRPSRSSRHTTRVSPFLSAFKHCSNSGLCVFYRWLCLHRQFCTLLVPVRLFADPDFGRRSKFLHTRFVDSCTFTEHR